MPKSITVEEIKEGIELAIPIRNKFSQVLWLKVLNWKEGTKIYYRFGV